MEFLIFGVGAALVLVAIVLGKIENRNTSNNNVNNIRYVYSRKKSVMTGAEWSFFKRLSTLAAGQYFVFPQIHLSSLVKNETKGRYYKLAFQRINRRSVDFVLCDKQTGNIEYAIELDDWSHDSESRRYRDEMVERLLQEAKIPLVRFRNVKNMNDVEIIDKFKSAAAELRN